MTMTAADAAESVRTGARTARELTQQALDRIAQHDTQLRAFRTVRAEHALAEADAVDRRPDRSRLPLAGVPIAIKDNIPVAGEYLGNGSKATGRSPQPADHEVVSRLRAAGAVVIGLTNVPELCVFGATDSAAAGITRNPWDHSRTPGGSSGGSAAAVASGMVAAAHGNDGMGSIRIPAACSGLVGIKPGLGTVPANLGNGSWFDMAENGPLTTTVEDCALLLSVMAARPELALDAEPRALRIAVSVKAPVTGVTVERHFAEAAHQTGELLRQTGHAVRTRELGYPLSAGPAAMARWFAGAERDAQALADRSQLDRRVARHARAGQLVARTGSPRPAGRASWQRAAQRYFEDVDILITPMLAQLPLQAVPWHARGWLANLMANVRYAPFAAPWNLAGWPAMAVPAGTHPSGMPLSVQLVGVPGSEHLLLRLAAQLEQLRPWQRIAPSYAVES